MVLEDILEFGKDTFLEQKSLDLDIENTLEVVVEVDYRPVVEAFLELWVG